MPHELLTQSNIFNEDQNIDSIISHMVNTLSKFHKNMNAFKYLHVEGKNNNNLIESVESELISDNAPLLLFLIFPQATQINIKL